MFSTKRGDYNYTIVTLWGLTLTREHVTLQAS